MLTYWTSVSCLGAVSGLYDLRWSASCELWSHHSPPEGAQAPLAPVQAFPGLAAMAWLVRAGACQRGRAQHEAGPPSVTLSHSHHLGRVLWTKLHFQGNRPDSELLVWSCSLPRGCRARGSWRGARYEHRGRHCEGRVHGAWSGHRPEERAQARCQGGRRSCCR